MKFTIERNWINILGHIWQPGIGPCGLWQDLSKSDIENMRSNEGEITREDVAQWLAAHAGDFQEIIDFRAIVGEQEFPWAKEENEMIYWHCMNPDKLGCEKP